MKEVRSLELFPNFFSFQTYDQKKRLAFALWLLIAVFCVIQSLITHRYNNYLIFENTCRNLINQTSFYAGYPMYHFDANHYGPIFSVFFMPFAALPNALGFMAWNLFNTIVLFKAIETIPIKDKLPLFFVAIPCIASATLSQQFNPASGAFIILSYTLLNKNKGFWSAMFIALGTFIKLYGIVGLAFFFFVKDKKRFVAYLLLWSAIFFFLPMLFSSPDFIINSYKEWAISLIHKNASNIVQNNLDISIMGFIRSIYVNHNLPNTVFLIAGMALFGLPYLNFKAYQKEVFQVLILGSTLMFPVLFSTGTEDCTYIIAVSAVGIWYVLGEKKQWKTWLLWITIVLTCNFPLLLFPKISTAYPVLLTIMSVPFFLIWLFILYKACMVNRRGPEPTLVST